MGRKNKRNRDKYFDNPVFLKYYNRLMEIAMSRFKWSGLPDTVDARFLEYTLCNQGFAIFFEDDGLGYLALQCMIGGELSVYRIPKDRTAYAVNGYNNRLTIDNSVIIYNNYMHTNDLNYIRDYAMQLTNIDMTTRTNVHAQKTPILILANDKNMTAMINTYEDYSGDKPFIFADRDSFDDKAIKVLQTYAPYVADKLYDLKSKVWNEALTWLGIPNINENKKERMISDEVERQNGGTLASRNSSLGMRKFACDEINKMFGLNISVDFVDNLSEYRNEFRQRNSDGEGVNDNDSLS